MNDMHFDGTIIKADFHPQEGDVKSSIQLRVIIDVTEEIFIEEQGTITELGKKFEFSILSGTEWGIDLVGRPCTVLRNAEGYHFIALLPVKTNI